MQLLSRFTAYTILSLALAIVTGLSSAAESEAVTVSLWPQDAITTSTLPAEQTLPSRGDNIVRVTSVTRPSITLYRAAKTTTTPTPAMLVCPGGAYKHLAVNIEGTEIAAWLNSIGITAAVLKYHTPGDRPAAFQDAQRAMRLLRQHSSEWNIDPARVGVMGFSAGGHLATRLSTAFNQLSYPPVDSTDNQSCRPDFCVLIYPAYLADKEYKLADDIAVTTGTAGTPPTFLVQTQDDKSFIAGSMAYTIALQKAGIPSELHIFPVGGHGYGMRLSKNAVSGWPILCKAWLQQFMPGSDKP